MYKLQKGGRRKKVGTGKKSVNSISRPERIQNKPVGSYFRAEITYTEAYHGEEIAYHPNTVRRPRGATVIK